MQPIAVSLLSAWLALSAIAFAPAAAAAAPAARPAAPVAAAAVPAGPTEPIDPYRYARPVDAASESAVWRSNITTIVVLLFVWGLIVAAYSVLVNFGVLGAPGLI